MGLMGLKLKAALGLAIAAFSFLGGGENLYADDCPTPESASTQNTVCPQLQSVLKPVEAVTQAFPTEAVNLEKAAASFVASGFACQPVSPSEGLTCLGKIAGYPKEVALIIPPGYRPTPSAELIVHLHGHNDQPEETLTQLITRFKFSSALATSGRNSIYVIPWSQGQCRDFEKKLVDQPGHFTTFVDNVSGLLSGTALTQSAEVGSIALTGHSGAYRSLAKIVRTREYADRIRELYLLDSAYGRADDFADFARDPSHRFWSASRPEDKNFQATSAAIRAQLEKARTPFYLAPVPKVSRAKIRTHRIGFVPSDQTHSGTAIRYLPEFLKVP